MASRNYFINLSKKDKEWYFQLWYTKKQEMGNSIGYKSIEECEKGLNNFKNFIIENNNLLENNKLFRIEKNSEESYNYIIFDLNNNVLYKSRNLSKTNCKKSANSTLKNFPTVNKIKIELE